LVVGLVVALVGVLVVALVGVLAVALAVALVVALVGLLVEAQQERTQNQSKISAYPTFTVEKGFCHRKFTGSPKNSNSHRRIHAIKKGAK
jgi:hypothetical protein